MTLTERRILANQYRILALLDNEQSEDYSAKAEALERGYETHFDDEWFTKDEDVLPADQCQEVLSVLSMYDDLFVSFGKLTDKSGIEPQDVVFRGFDGNDETKHMAYAKFFCETFDGGRRFQTLRAAPGFEFNSHTPSLSRYRAMLPVYRAARDARRGSTGYQPLSNADIKQVLAAR